MLPGFRIFWPRFYLYNRTMRRRGSTTSASSRSRSRSNSVGSSGGSLPGTTENGLGTKKRRRSRDAMALVDGGRGGRPPNAWLDRCGDTAANCGNWKPALVSGVVDDTTTATSSSTRRGRSGRMSAPAVLQSSNSGAKSSSEEEVDSDGPTSEKEDEEDNGDGGDGAVDDGKDIADGGGGAVEGDSDADDGEDARSAWNSACHRKGRRIMDLPRLLFAMETHTCCRSCSEWMLVQYMRDFAAYYDSEAGDGESAADALERFLRSRSGGGHRLRVRLPSHQLDREVRKGLASKMTFKCGGMSSNLGGGHTACRARQRPLFPSL